jgi:hypothetical protein
MNTNLDEFALRDDESTLSADSSPADTTFDALQAKIIEQWSGNTFTGILAANDQASSVIQSVIDAAAALERTYTVTITADTSAATAAIAALGRNLPSSPAKEGPLSKVPSFDYVVDSFVRSMTAMEETAKRSLSKVSSSLDNLSTLQSFKSSFGSDPGSFLLQRDLQLTGARGGTTIVNNNHVQAPSFAALTTQEFAELLKRAESGVEAHQWVSDNHRTFSTVLR